MSDRIAGLMIIAAQIALHALGHLLSEERKFSIVVYIMAMATVWIVAFANLWVFMKAVLLITGWN